MDMAIAIISSIGIPGIISGVFVLIVSRMLKKRDESEAQIKAQNEELEKQSRAIMLGLQAVLRDRLLQGYRHYFEKGWADYDDRENLENVYAQYHALGENGIMDGYRQRFMSLPVSKDKKMEG